jgi:hypothetical protein
MLQFGDPKLLLRDERRVFRGFRAGDRKFRFQRGDFIKKGCARSIHDKQ